MPRRRVRLLLVSLTASASLILLCSLASHYHYHYGASYTALKGQSADSAPVLRALDEHPDSIRPPLQLRPVSSDITHTDAAFTSSGHIENQPEQVTSLGLASATPEPSLAVFLSPFEQPKEEAIDPMRQNVASRTSVSLPLTTQSPAFKIPVPHWTKSSDFFPVPYKSVIPLPKGKPVQINRIQHAFGTETEAFAKKRIERLDAVRNEMRRAWTGYRNNAWMHDEVRPISGGFRDPFCGWAATLVDALDTLWIMGLKDEFDEAAHAVANIDFTTSKCEDIPVFETIIRFLGGLLGAYDVSGGADSKYPVLLRKAVELADLLMAVFDTPNRMPVLHFSWRSDRLPRRAGLVSVAEVGTMSLEFTRLAQHTGNNRYYDAIARITNALEDLQLETSIPGIFPEYLDASGCNTSAMHEIRERLRLAASASSDAAASTASSTSVASAATFAAFEVDYSATPFSSPSVSWPAATASFLIDSEVKKSPDDGSHLRGSLRPRSDPEPGLIAALLRDCVPQKNLVPAGWLSEEFHMGASQDSAYEYFPKEYLLLGGLEPKYLAMHERVVYAVKTHLLYRPMVPDGRDIRFSSKNIIRKSPDSRTQIPEATHLTCFLGGMIALGGRLLQRAEDIEIAAKFTDGCVWAYESMPSGIMPEAATVLACSSPDHCEWNQTAWYLALDPHGPRRDQAIAVWEERRKEGFMVYNATSINNSRADQLDFPAAFDLSSATSVDARPIAKVPTVDSSNQFQRRAIPDLLEHYPRPEPGTPEAHALAAALKAKALASTENLDPSHHLHNHEMQDPLEQYPRPEPGSPEAYALGLIHPRIPSMAVDSKLDDDDDDDDEDNVNTQAAQKKEGNQAPKERHPEAYGPHDEENLRPQSHLETVQSILSAKRLPPGFVSVPAKYYILRPEALESVWYMYRITGNAEWMDKGWRMFEHILAATQVEFGHSALSDVTFEPPPQRDEMESFWFSETLKYLYLLYSEPSVISLDEWVLNTEAHPFRRPL